MAKSLQATSGDLKGTIDNEDKVLQAMANAVPSEIRGDFQTFEQAFHQYLQAISKLNIKAGSVPSADQIAQLTSAAKAFSTPKLRAAEQHLSAWASKKTVWRLITRIRVSFPSNQRPFTSCHAVHAEPSRSLTRSSRNPRMITKRAGC